MTKATVSATRSSVTRQKHRGVATDRMVPTYADVEIHAADRLRGRGASEAVISNTLCAFRGFMAYLDKSPDTPVDFALTTEFEESLTAYLDAKSLLGRKASSLKTRASQLRQFHRVARSITLVDGIGKFREALETAMRSRNVDVLELAKAAGMPPQLIRGWLGMNHEPKAVSWGHIAKIEEGLGLERDVLASRCPWYERERNRRTEFVKPPIAYRVLMAELRKTHYRLRVYSERLRSEWLALLAFKTDVLLTDGESRLERWTLRPRDDDTRDRGWFATVGTEQSPTAENVFQMLTRYWGFLCLPGPEGQGMSETDMSLAHIADIDRLFAYLKWHKGRMGHFNKSALSILGTTASLLRPRTGFVWQRAELAARAPADIQAALHRKFAAVPESQRWQAWCAHVHERVRKLMHSLRKEKLVEQSRSTSEPIRAILQSPAPLEYLARALAAHDRSEPPRHHKLQWAVHCRDGLLWAVLLATVVRSKHLGLMTYRPDNSGHLYRRPDGGWALRFERSLFKNFKGAAADRDYDVSLPQSVAKRIETYLTEARPLLQSPECAYFFRPCKTKNAKHARPLSDEAVYEVVRSMATRYIPECSGFGPHAFRHIVPTDWLKTHPRDYMTVALILHDKLETVVANYCHLAADDGMRHYAQHVDKTVSGQRIPRKG